MLLTVRFNRSMNAASHPRRESAPPDASSSRRNLSLSVVEVEVPQPSISVEDLKLL